MVQKYFFLPLQEKESYRGYLGGWNVSLSTSLASAGHGKRGEKTSQLFLAKLKQCIKVPMWSMKAISVPEKGHLVSMHTFSVLIVKGYKIYYCCLTIENVR